MPKQKPPSKQRSIRFTDDMMTKVEIMAEQEGRTFSAQVMWLLRGALTQPPRTFVQPQPSSQPHAA